MKKLINFIGTLLVIALLLFIPALLFLLLFQIIKWPAIQIASLPGITNEFSVYFFMLLSLTYISFCQSIRDNPYITSLIEKTGSFGNKFEMVCHIVVIVSTLYLIYLFKWYLIFLPMLLAFPAGFFSPWLNLERGISLFFATYIIGAIWVTMHLINKIH